LRENVHFLAADMGAYPESRIDVEPHARRGLRLAACLLACAMVSSLAFAQTMYKSVTPDGRVMYSDQPPAAAKVVRTFVPDTAPSSALPASALDQASTSREAQPAVAPGAGVVLFSASWCGYCAKAKEYLAAKGIAYRDYDVDTPGGRNAYVQAGGRRGIPLLVSGGRRIEGFSTAAYDRFFSTP
jgi:glutaredoxin